MKIRTLAAIALALWLGTATAGVGTESAPDLDEEGQGDVVQVPDEDEDSCLAAGQPCDINNPGACCSQTCAATEVQGEFACFALTPPN